MSKAKQEDAIEVGAKYEFTSNSDFVGGFVITNIWIEESDTNITVKYILQNSHPDASISGGKRPSSNRESVHITDLQKCIDKDEVERTNTAHEAWKWRRQDLY